MPGLREALLKSIFHNENNPAREGCLVNIDGSSGLLVVGDLHGEPGSLEQILDMTPDSSAMVFLGDYVDRGPDSLKVLKRITDIQLKAPDKVVLLRGNHEDWEMNVRYGFAQEIRSKGQQHILSLIHEWYESLPLMAVFRDILMLHGGPPYPLPENMGQLKNISISSSQASHILWSDPDDELYYPRGGDTRAFTKDEFERFIRIADCRYLIRGHQYNPKRGYKVNFGTCLTIFSADYGMDWKRSFFYLPENARTAEFLSRVETF